MIERMVDRFAAEIGMDPAEVRRKNFIQPQDFPYDNGMGLLPYDSGNYEPALDKALAMVGYQNFRQEQAEARKQGKYLGLGLSTYVEICGVAPSAWIGLPGQGWGAGLWESANVKVHLTGKVVVTTGSTPQGQGHETTFAQLVSDELGIPYDDIDVEHSDTLGAPFGVPPTVTTIAGTYTRLQAQLTIPPDYQSSATLDFGTGQTNPSVTLTASFGWMGGSTATLTVPDFSSVSGWSNAWAPVTGTAVAWSVMVTGTNLTNTQCVDHGFIKTLRVTGGTG